MLVPMLGASAQPVPTPSDGKIRMETYGNVYQQVARNIEAYNSINDGLFGSYEREEWVAAFKDRAYRSSLLLDENQSLLDDFMANLRSEHFDLELMAQGIYDSVYSISPDRRLPDSFLCEEILSVQRQHLARLKDRDAACMEAYMQACLALTKHQMVTSISGDPQAFRQSYEGLRELVDHYKPGRDVPLTSLTLHFYLEALTGLVGHKEYITRGMSTVDELTQLHLTLMDIIGDSTYVRLIPERRRQAYKSVVTNFNMSLLRNVLLPDTTHRYDALRDSLLTVYVDYYDQRPEVERSISLSNQRKLIVMRERLGRIGPLEAREQTAAICAKLSKQIRTELDLSDKLNCLLECVYFTDVSDLTFDAKRQTVLAYCDEIFADLANLHYQNKMPNITRTLEHIATYPRIHRYLQTAERKRFLETLLFYSQPFTRAHSEMVALLSGTILRRVIEVRPDLLTGMLGYATAEQVQRDPQRMLDFMDEASRYHDLGKTRMPDIIRNDYRKLSDHEFDIIRRHSELGLEFLQVDSSLTELHDIVLGHHRWYDGKGGYPEYFDYTKSPYRVLIDILSLADCLEAATSQLGRNYRKNKHYDDVVAEFEAQAGTRYNPQLVDLLKTQPTLSDELRRICETGWEDVYYRVFCGR